MTLAVRMEILPPLGMASRALTTRLMITCSSWSASARSRQRWETSVVVFDVFADNSGGGPPFR